MSGNTSDEFPSYIEASSKEDLKKKAEEIFGKNAETLCGAALRSFQNDVQLLGEFHKNR